VPDDLLVSQLDIGTTVLEAHDGDVLETHERNEDLTSVKQDEGGSCFLADTTSLKRLRLFLGDPRHPGTPAEIHRTINE
jgi:hypothetical protein